MEGIGRGLIQVLSLNLPGGTEKKPRRSSVRIADVPSQILSWYLPNTKLKPKSLDQFSR
jgi:hypothetical protein